MYTHAAFQTLGILLEKRKETEIFTESSGILSL